MNKLELVHLHGLLACIAEDCVDRAELEAADLTEYQDLGISPVSIQESRSRHKVAVQTLAATLTETSNDDVEAETDDVELFA